MSTGNDYDQSSDPQRKAEDSILESFQASPPESPFSSVQQKVDSTRQTLQDLEDATEQLARTIGLPAPRGQTQRKALILAAQWVLDSPDLTGINVKAPEWDSHEVELNELLSAGIALSIIHMEFSQFLAPEAWAIEADRIRDDLVHSGTGPTRLLSGDYRHAKSILSEICLASPPDELSGQLILLNAIIEYQDKYKTIGDHLDLGISLFGQRRIADPKSWPELEAISIWRRKLGEEIKLASIPAGILDYLGTSYSREILRPMVIKLETLAQAHQDHAVSVATKLDIERRSLLDLSMQNPLLNYRLLRSRGVSIGRHTPHEILNALAEEEQTAILLPGKEPKQISSRSRQRNLELTTVHPADELDRRLTSTYRLANSFIQEQGVNTLFLALGMLEWVESGSSSESRYAPMVLLPVSLERTHPQKNYLLRHTGDEPESNVSLREKLRLEFGITLPELPESDAFDIREYLDAVTEAVSGQEGWTVDRDRVVLGFFSFSKFLMYRDLDIKNWPDDASPSEHPIIASLLEDGFEEPFPKVTSDDNLDSVLLDREHFQVVDADGSQTLALLDINQGINLTIQGPPGTGKSQTITNIIAEAVGRGKTVLFVSEKMAALEVVKRRLDEVGLGDACLELHSHKTAKKIVLDELSRTLDLGRPRLGPADDDIAELENLRERLNRYSKAINMTIGESGVTPFQAAGELMGSKGIAPPDIPINNISQWSQSEYRLKRSLVEELQARVDVMGPVKDHPFWGTRLTSVFPADLNNLRIKLESYQSALLALPEPTGQLVQTMQLLDPANLAETDMLASAALLATDAPNLEHIDAKHTHWVERPDDIRALISAGKAMAALQTDYNSSLQTQAWDQDLTSDKFVLENQGHKLWRFMNSDFRRTKARLSRLQLTGAKNSVANLLAMVRAVESYQYNKTIFNVHGYLGTELFGAKWKDLASDWTQLSTATEWLLQLHDAISGEMIDGVLNYISRGPVSTNLREITANLETATMNLRRTASDITSILHLDVMRRFQMPGDLADQAFDKQLTLPLNCLPQIESVHDMVRFNIQEENCHREGLQALLETAYQWSTGDVALRDSYDRAWFESLWDRALREHTELRSFDGAAHEQIRANFQKMDRHTLEHNRARIAQTHWERMPRNQGGGQLAVLRRQFELRRRHIPIRQLLERAGNPVQKIKPVFMMSPLSIAAYLSPRSIKFDLVVFDEASQVKPVDALGAVMRSNQVVVVGDSQQLPPTPFFENASSLEESPDEELTSDIESILGLFASQNAPTRMLRWHYRSRHDSLIAVSNQEFYGGSLILFPSPNSGKQDTGLFYHHLMDTVYGRGTTSSNPLEAQAIAYAVMEHARIRPDQSLGVVAFSMAQTNEILEQLDALREADPSNEHFFSAHLDEPFFVKNLETVQGDERDVILISIGYGRADDGRVDLNFGPLNREGGERRLNVLITRARRRCEVFTNMTENDIDLNRTNSRGIQALRTFLAFANSGILDSASEESASDIGTGSNSQLKKLITEAISNKGYMVTETPGWGSGTVDLAVSDPGHPESYILGIEFDGPTYDSAKSARDRDRLRPQVLEGLGWRLFRAWSPQWISNLQRELERVMSEIDSYEVNAPTVIPELEHSQVKPPATIIRDEVPSPDTNIQVAKYQFTNLILKESDKNMTTASTVSLLLWAAKVVDTESPVHISEIPRRIYSAAGVTRASKNLQATMDKAIDRMIETGRVSRRGDFLWNNDMTQPPVRDRSGLTSATRKLNMISDEELEEAICFVVERSYGIARGQAPTTVFKLMGYRRTNQAMKDRFNELVNNLLSDGRLGDEGEHLVLASQSDN